MSIDPILPALLRPPLFRLPSKSLRPPHNLLAPLLNPLNPRLPDNTLPALIGEPNNRIPKKSHRSTSSPVSSPAVLLSPS